MLTTSHSQTFPCDGSLLFATNNGSAPTLIYKVFFAPFGGISYGRISAYTDGYFDALGFNATDNFMYAIEVNTNKIVRLKANNTFETIGVVPFVDTLNVSAGDCTPEGLYICHDKNLDQLLVIDVIDGFNVRERIDLIWDSASFGKGPIPKDLDDLVIDPSNPKLAYTHHSDLNSEEDDGSNTRGFILSINIDLNSPDKGKITPKEQIPSDVIKQFGSLFFSSSGNLYGYGADFSSFSTIQNKLVGNVLSPKSITKFNSNGPGAYISDGCSCPYGLNFINDVTPRDVLCTDTEVTYNLSLTNNFFIDFDDFRLIDTLPKGMVITEVTGNYMGHIMEGTGIGTRILIIEELAIAAKQTINIAIKVKVEDIIPDLTYNQAIIENIPERLGGKIISDDPSSGTSLGDPTKFIGVAQTINEIDINIQNPPDCINAEDTRVDLKSTVLQPSETYNITLRDESYDFLNYIRTINADNSFSIEGLVPGEYELYGIAPTATRCSFRLKDTSIHIMAPNDQLTLMATSNSPVCLGESLQLLSEMSPGGEVEWKGPNRFVSEQSNTSVERSTYRDTGTYNLVATYGVCEQKRSVKVDVLPTVKAEIIGRLEYCQGETIQLNGSEIDVNHDFTWSTPDNTIALDTSLIITQSELYHDGIYQLIIDNGACKDTAFSEVIVHEYSKIKLDEFFFSDFCGKQEFLPQITGDLDVSYQWSPEQGLDCYDCPNPTLNHPLAPFYQLMVENKNQCQDSAFIKIRLLQDKLIYVPNAFSPNDDGENDLFEWSPGCGIATINEVNIADRAGNNIYAAGPFLPNDSIQYWNGSRNGKSLNPGVYIWSMHLTLIDGSDLTIHGDVTLIK